MCASGVSISGQDASREVGTKRTSVPRARLTTQSPGSVSEGFTLTPEASPSRPASFPPQGNGTSEKVGVPPLNPKEQGPEEEGFPRREGTQCHFPLGPAPRKVNKVLPSKPEIPSKRVPGRPRAVIKNTETRTMSRAQSQKFIGFGLCCYISWKKKKKSVKKTKAACGCGGPDTGRLTDRPWA